MVGGLADLATFAQEYTWVMIVVLWLSGGVGYQMLSGDVGECRNDIEKLAENQRQMRQELKLIDQKQGNIMQTQDVVLARISDSEEELQELREEHARMDAFHRHRSRGDD